MFSTPEEGSGAGREALSQKTIGVWFPMGMLATDANAVNPSCIGSTFTLDIAEDPKG